MLSGKLPDSIGNLDKLTYFSVAENTLSGTIPSSFKNLGNIDHFNIGVAESIVNILVRLSYKVDLLALYLEILTLS